MLLQMYSRISRIEATLISFSIYIGLYFMNVRFFGLIFGNIENINSLKYDVEIL